MTLDPKTIDDQRLDELLTDPDWCVQQKYDGIRCIVVCKDGAVQSFNKRGEVAGEHSPANLHELVAEFPTDEAYILDGELAWGRYYPFDELTHPEQPYLQRLTQTLDMVDRWKQPHIRRVRCWRTERSKRAAFARAKEQQIEGVILRRLSAPHAEGSHADVAVRYKFRKRVDVIIDGMARTRSIRAGLVDADGCLTHVGNVGIPRMSDLRTVKAAVAGEGDVVAEIEYGSVTANGKLQEARFIRARDDKKAAECTIDQMVFNHEGELDDQAILAGAPGAPTSKLPRRGGGKAQKQAPTDWGWWLLVGCSALVLFACGFLKFLRNWPKAPKTRSAPSGGGGGGGGWGGGDGPNW